MTKQEIEKLKKELNIIDKRIEDMKLGDAKDYIELKKKLNERELIKFKLSFVE